MDDQTADVVLAFHLTSRQFVAFEQLLQDTIKALRKQVTGLEAKLDDKKATKAQLSNCKLEMDEIKIQLDLVENMLMASKNAVYAHRVSAPTRLKK